MDIIIDSCVKILAGMPQFALLLIGLIIAKLIYQWTSSYNFNDELTEKDNPAFGVSLAGYLVGAGIALTGSLFGSTGNLTEEATDITIGVIAVIVLMRLSVWLNDCAILYKFSVKKEISNDRNAGTGFVLAGTSISTGLMLNGVLSGHSDSMMLGMRDIAVYWALGQFILIVGALLFQLVTSYDFHKVIGNEDNMPAGISLGGFMVALGFITRNALIGATSHLIEEILVTLVFAITGMLLLVLTRIIVDRVLLPKSPLSKEVVIDRNPAAGSIAAVSFIVVAIIFAAAVNPHPVPSAEEIMDEEIINLPAVSEPPATAPPVTTLPPETESDPAGTVHEPATSQVPPSPGSDRPEKGVESTKQGRETR